jgi:adenylate cyclase class 2
VRRDAVISAETPEPDFATASELLTLLGYAENKLTGENTVKVYARYGIELESIQELRFTGLPGGCRRG